MRLLLTIALLFVAVILASIARAEDAPAVEPTFEELVRQGDLARFGGNNSDAVRAYARALKIRNEPRVAGRLGLVALAGGAPAQAAHYLMRAIVDIHTIPPGERQQIKDAFDRARPLVSRVGLRISHVGAQVTIDGKPESMGTSATDFYVFRMPGHHEFRAALEGFEDAVVVKDTLPGETVEVSLVLTPLPAAPPPPVVTCEPRETKAELVAHESPPKPGPSTKDLEDAEDKRVRGQWVPGIGGTILYGAVSPYPATGFVLSSHWKWNAVISAGFDFRAAISPRGIEGYAIRGTTITLFSNICATREWFTGCLGVPIGMMWHSSLTPPVAIRRPLIGGGVTFGARFARYRSVDFHVKLFGEFLVDEYPIARHERATPIWVGPPYMAGLNIWAVWNRTK